MSVPSLSSSRSSSLSLSPPLPPPPQPPDPQYELPLPEAQSLHTFRPGDATVLEEHLCSILDVATTQLSEQYAALTERLVAAVGAQQEQTDPGELLDFEGEYDIQQRTDSIRSTHQMYLNQSIKFLEEIYESRSEEYPADFETSAARTLQTGTPGNTFTMHYAPPTDDEAEQYGVSVSSPEGLLQVECTLVTLPAE